MASLLARLNGRSGKGQATYGQGISSSDLPRSISGESRFQDAAQEAVENEAPGQSSPLRPSATDKSGRFDDVSLSSGTSQGPLSQPLQRGGSADKALQMKPQRSHEGSLSPEQLHQGRQLRKSAENTPRGGAVAPTQNRAEPDWTSPEATRRFLTASTSSRYYNEFGAPQGQGPFGFEASRGIAPGMSTSTMQTEPVRRGKGKERSSEEHKNDNGMARIGSGGAGAASPVSATVGPTRPGVMSQQPSQRLYKTLPAMPPEPVDRGELDASKGWRAVAAMPLSPKPSKKEGKRRPSHQQQQHQGPPPRQSSESMARLPAYGYTPLGWDKQMDVPKVAELVLMCGEQIRTRGLDSPLIFSSLALGLSGQKVSRLIQNYLRSPRDFFTNELRFAESHDLAAMIKWALARLGRAYPVPLAADNARKSGDNVAEETVFVHQRGFLDVDSYQTWAAQERSAQYPVAAFSNFLDILPSSTAALLVALLSLLSSTTSYSLKNGMTPSRLGRLFGSLIFGLPEDETFDKTYDSYVRVSNAAEHLLLAYIRDTSATETLPVRLADHVRGYPSMLTHELMRFPPGVRTIPITTVRRNVRLYSVDLVRQAAELRLSDTCSEWAACCGASENNSNGAAKSMPQITDHFRKLINLRAGATLPADGQRVGHEQDIESYKSLTDKAWGDFMDAGFAQPDQSKLAFDLYESQRKGSRVAARGAEGWNSFEEKGFALGEDGLDSVLAFDQSISEDLRKWPEDRAELMQRLHKTDKGMPHFQYDTTPYVAASPARDGSKTGQWHDKPYTKIDDVFPEVYADYLLCNGWSNRDELTHRNANFALVQYKSRPSSSTVDGGRSPQKKRNSRIIDDRTDAAWFVIEEVVPSQYRTELEAVGRKKNKSRASMRALQIFKRKKGPDGGGDQGNFGHDNFLDEIFKSNLGSGTRKISGTPRNLAIPEGELERIRSQSTLRGHEESTDTAMAGDTSTVGNGGTTSRSKLLSSLKMRATKRILRGRTSRTQTVGDDSASRNQAAEQTGGAFESGEYDAHSLQDSEIEAIAASSATPTKKLNKIFTMGRAVKQPGDDAWLEVAPRGSRSRADDQELSEFEQGQTSRYAEYAPMGTSTLGQEKPMRQARNGVATRPHVGDQDQQPSFVTANEEAQGAQSQLPPLSPTMSSMEGEGTASPPRKYTGPGWVREELDMSTQPESTVQSLSPSSETQYGRLDRPPSSQDGFPSADATRTPSPGREVSRFSSAVHARKSPAPPILSDPSETPHASLTERSPPVDSRTAGATLDLPQSPNSPDPATDHVGPTGAELPSRANLKPPSARNDGKVSPEDQEKAREERITAAKQRARELRAGLNRVTAAEADKDMPDRRSPKPSSPTFKDDPFSKDRFSGRVASITSKFGGTTAKPVTPQSTGEKSHSTSGSTEVGAGATKSTLSSGHARQGQLGSTQSNQGAFPYVPEIASRSTAATTSSWIRTASSDSSGDAKPPLVPAKSSSRAASLTSPTAPSEVSPPNPPPRSDSLIETLNGEEGASSSDAYGGIADTETIYPDDAASNFAPDAPDDDPGSSRTGNSPQQTPVSLFSHLGQSPAMAGAAAAAAYGAASSANGSDSQVTPAPRHPGDSGRHEAEDRATDLASRDAFMPRYQPGMPLSNVEEERESILSGSNV